MSFSDRPLLNNVLLTSISTLLIIALVEIIFRSIDYDFSHQSELFDSTPTYYRQPTVPIGPVFSARMGRQYGTATSCFKD